MIIIYLSKRDISSGNCSIIIDIFPWHLKNGHE